MTTLVRWDPLRELDTLLSEMNRLFDGFFGDRLGERHRRWAPAMDLVETDEHLVLRADLPGLERDDIDLEVKDGVLTISGERKADHEEKGDNFHRVQRAYGSFARSVTLPEGVDAERITAEFDRGVLEVRFPKPEESKPVRIQIGAGPTVEGTATEK